MPSLSLDIPNDSDLAKKIRDEVRTRVQRSEKKIEEKFQKWREADDRALAFLPVRDVDEVRKRDRDNGLPQYTTIQIPYSYAVLMAAHTYITSVFLNRSPVFQYSGRHGEAQQSVQAVEALVDYQLTVGEMLVPLYIWLQDFLKYGIGVIGNYWDDRIQAFSTIDMSDPPTDPITGQPLGKGTKQLSRFVGRAYSGNRIYNKQPWDFLWDTRYPAWEFQKGEYCAFRFSLNWNECKRREFQGYYINLDKLPRGDTSTGQAFNAPSSSLNRPETTDPGTRDFQSDYANKDHPSMVDGYEMYIELIPKEWDSRLGNSTYPEKWVFTVSQDFKTLIGAQPLGAFHCKFPAHILCLEPEGYGLTTRGLPEILEPVQNTIDWLINSHFYNIRSALNNKFVVDPSRVVMKDVLNPLPGGVVRLKPAAYGTDPALAIRQMQITDVTQAHLRDLPTMLGIGERAVGINDQIMGMLNTGGRKTATEVRTSTSFGVNRLKTISEFASAQGFDGLSQMIVQNSQQFYDQELMFKIAGDQMQTASPNFMRVTPEDIMGYYNFVPVDGTLPIDRYAQGNLWLQMFTQIGRMPQIMQQYDLGKMFAWVASLMGLKNIGQFKIQLAPDQTLAMQAAAGNSIPMLQAAGGPPATAAPAGGVPEPGQLPGMGTTG